jgi:hypothetical protein
MGREELGPVELQRSCAGSCAGRKKRENIISTFAFFLDIAELLQVLDCGRVDI